MIALPRRKFLVRAGQALAAAPFIVRPGSLMKILRPYVAPASGSLWEVSWVSSDGKTVESLLIDPPEPGNLDLMVHSGPIIHGYSLGDVIELRHDGLWRLVRAS